MNRLKTIYKNLKDVNMKELPGIDLFHIVTKWNLDQNLINKLKVYKLLHTNATILKNDLDTNKGILKIATTSEEINYIPIYQNTSRLLINHIASLEKKRNWYENCMYISLRYHEESEIAIAIIQQDTGALFGNITLRDILV